MTERRFPPPWSVDELEACFVVKDGAGQKLAYVYFENDPGRRSAGQSAQQRRGAADRGQYGEVAAVAARLLKRGPRDEARMIAANIAKMPGLLREKID